MSDYFKKIVDIIKKEAQEIPVPSRRRGDVKVQQPKSTNTQLTQNSANKPQTSVNYQNSTSSIKEMQTAIQIVYKAISDTIDYDKLQNGLANPQTADAKGFQQSYSKDGFGNFLVNTYLRNAPTKGKEFDPSAAKTKQEDKNPSDLKNISVVLDSINRIGKSSKELTADGVWGFRTNNALQNISAIGDSLVKLGRDLGMKSTSFDISKLSELRPLIRENDKEISIQEKSERAKKITIILKGILVLFKDFKEQVFERPGYKELIDGTQPIFQAKTKEQSQKDKLENNLNADEKSIRDDLQSNQYNSKYVNYNNSLIYFNVAIPAQYTNNVQVKPFQITTVDLLSQDSFNNWINKNSILMSLKQQNSQSWPSIVKIILDEVKKQIADKASKGLS